MVTADQLRAARALLGLDQTGLAKRARVSLATLRRAERVNGKLPASERAVAAIQQALENAGAEFIEGGVRCRRKRSPEEVAERVRRIMEIAEHSAKLQAQYPGGFTEDDLYDENGLPA